VVGATAGAKGHGHAYEGMSQSMATTKRGDVARGSDIVAILLLGEEEHSTRRWTSWELGGSCPIG
jgi:hypothetical protein